MEYVLDVYERPHDPLCPVVCLDETNRQLIEQRSMPAEPGHLERMDYEYRRHGVVDLFVAFEPLACKRVGKLPKAVPRWILLIFCGNWWISIIITAKRSYWLWTI